MTGTMICPYAVGEGLYLRPYDTDDVPELIQWLNDPVITETLTFRWPMSRSQETIYVEDLYVGQKDLTLGICLKPDNRLIGGIGLQGVDNVNRRAGFGVFIGEAAEWGKGYATEATRLMIDVAFDRLNLRRLELDVYAFNPAAKRVYEKLGFQVEGTRREHVFWRGQYHDSHLMALLRDEWRLQRP